MLKFVFSLFLLTVVSASIGYCYNSTISGCSNYNYNYTFWYYYYYYAQKCPCLNCTSPYILGNGFNGQQCCSQPAYRCGDCNNANKTCVRCLDQFGFNLTNNCVACTTNISLANCTRCLTITACEICNEFNALNGTVCVICYEFMPYCLRCFSSKTICSSCNTSIYAVNSSVNPDICQLCNITLFSCLNCQNITHCINCDNRNKTVALYTQSGQFRCLYCYQMLLGCIKCNYEYYCIQCVNNSYALMPSTARCNLCSFTLYYCILCSSPLICLNCTSNRFALVNFRDMGFYLYCQYCGNLMVGCLQCSNNNTCTLCSNYAFNVTYGCTKIIGCKDVDPNLDFINNCIACDQTQFLPLNDSSRCYCIAGWLVGTFCTQIIGCTALAKINGTKTCMTCNFTMHFKAINGSCICIKGYLVNSIGLCQQICGDGLVFDAPCDDGNLINGDGCSNLCYVQQNYVCNRVVKVPQSKCIFKGRVQLKLNSINKVANANSIEIIFDINPFISAISKLNLTKGVTFNGSVYCSFRNVSLIGEQIVIDIDFNNTVTGSMVWIFVNFDPDYIKSPNFVLQFALVPTNGESLQYDQAAGSKNSENNLPSIIKILSFISLAVFFIGSFSYKMIGVETLHTIQLIMILLVNFTNYKSQLIDFSNLKIVYGQLGEIFIENAQRPNKAYQFLGYTRQTGTLDKYLVLGIIEIILFMVFSILYIRYIWIKSNVVDEELKMKDQEYVLNQTQENKINLKKDKRMMGKYSKIQHYFYNWLVFPIFIGFMYHFQITLIIKKIIHKNAQQNKFFVLLIFTISMVKFILFSFEFLPIFVKHIAQSHLLKHLQKSKYIALYLLNFIAISSLVITKILNMNQYFELQMISLLGLGLVYIIMQRPYRNCFHNFALFINQSSLLSVAVWMYLSNQKLVSLQFNLNMIYPLVATISIILLFAVIRIIVIFWEIYHFSKHSTKTTTVHQKLIQKDICQEGVVRKNKLIENHQNSILGQIIQNQHKYMKTLRQNLQRNIQDPFKPFQKQSSRKQKDEQLMKMKNIYRQQCRRRLI